MTHNMARLLIKLVKRLPDLLELMEVKYGRMFDPDGGAMGVMPIQVHGSDFFKPEFDIFRHLFASQT
jgi:hypothetical protein